MLNPRRFAIVAMIWTLVFGGGFVAGQDEKKADGDKAKSDSKTVVADATKSQKAVETKLVKPGEGEKTRLRFSLTKGYRQKVVVTMRSEAQMSLKESPVAFPKQKLPSQEITTEMVVTDVSESGDITYDLKIAKVEVKDIDGVFPQIVQMVEAAAKSLEGLSGTVVISNRGLFREAKFKKVDGLTPQAKQAVESAQQSLKEITSPFPEEAVGVGAQWTVERPVTQQGMKTSRKETYELLKLESGVATVKISVEQTAKPQEIENPNAGVKMKLLSLDAKGDGFSVLSLSKLAPDAGEMKMSSRTEMETEFAGQKQSMAMSMKIQMTVGEAKAAGASKAPKSKTGS